MAVNRITEDDISDRVVEDFENEQSTLVFPINVHESLAASSGLKKGEKVGIIVSFWIFGCLILAWFLAGWLRGITPTYYGWITFAVELILQLTVGMYILRFALDERAVFAEMSNDNKSFASYFKIYREIKAEDGSKYPFDVIEFDDGSYGVYLQCRLGHNTQRRSEATYEAHKAITDILNKSNLPRKIYYHSEVFKNSQAAQDLSKILTRIEDNTLFTAYRDIIMNYLSIAEDESNVLCVTYLIYAPNRIAKDDFVTTMHNVFNALERDETVYREIAALRYEEIVEFLRHYYRLEVLDMGLIRAYAASKKSINCSVSILKIYGSSGKVFVNDEYKKLSSELISQFGLEKAK